MFPTITLLSLALLVPLPREEKSNNLALVKITAVVTKDPKNGPGICNHCYFEFRNEQHRDVGVGFRTDVEGKAELLLSKGKWRLIRIDSCFDCGDTAYDVISPKQKRVIEVAPSQILDYRIELEFRKE